MEVGPDIAQSSSDMVLLPSHPQRANYPPTVPSFTEKPFPLYQFLLSLFHAPHPAVLDKYDDPSSDIAQSSFNVCLEKKDRPQFITSHFV